MNYAIYFIAFTIFLLCQYAIWVVSNLVAHYSNATGHYYWSIVIVVFLVLNELCFGAYDFGIDFNDDDDDWNGEL